MKTFKSIIVLTTIFMLTFSFCKKEAAKCGDGVKEGDELCDGDDFGHLTCQSFNFRRGTLRCSADCSTILYDNCINGCGNGRKEDDVGEECDGHDFEGDTCQMHGFDYGELKCNTDCTINTSECKNAICGNGELESEVEECEPASEITITCENLGFDEGEVKCYGPESENPCHYDTSGCVKWQCGDGKIDPGEQCDFDSDGNPMLGGATCEAEGYDFGNLSCYSPDYENELLRCRYDYSECGSYECGNEVVEGDEQCEVGVDITATCEEEGFQSGGPIECTSECRYDYSNCIGGCGNGVKEEEFGEDCDKEDVADATCESVLGPGWTGDVRCKPDCTYDTSMCSEA